ncbi:MAG: hypothetical protein ACFB9N_07825 [Geitlerinemataceae cyanobacterium]
MRRSDFNRVEFDEAASLFYHLMPVLADSHPNGWGSLSIHGGRGPIRDGRAPKVRSRLGFAADRE